MTKEWWGPDLDRSVWAWRAGRPAVGRDAAERLLASDDLPEAVRSTVVANSTWFAPLISELVPSARFTELALANRPYRSCFNPSLAVGDDGQLLATVRSSNYQLFASGSYEIDDASQVIRTSTVLVELDEEMQISSERVIVEPRDAARSDFPVRGYEDLRLFSQQDQLYALGTVRDRRADGLCQMILLELSLDGEVLHEHVIQSPEGDRHEKNWVVLDPRSPAGDEASQRGAVVIVYQWDPLTLMELDLTSGSLRPRGDPLSTGLGSQARGSTAGIRVQAGILSLIHEHVVMPDGGRRYLHRFVLLDDEARYVGKSPSFCFFHHGVEFAAGLAVRGPRALIGIGNADETAWIAEVAVAEIVGLIGSAV